ncbi:Na+/H+ antiporter NhaA [Actinomadura sp. NPDC048021]|uniref:Na+/H+ antiporter NhaA n=1 Tax=Actinomadura sp. NPDC048021 TaxID=3155385 RepID=UPI0033E91EB8
MTERRAGPPSGSFADRTAWARNLRTPLREFLRTETGGAVVLLAATVAALVWANADASSYERVWETQVSVRFGGAGLSQDLRQWVNSGLMTVFFFVVGLEARREFDMGELRDRRRFALPLAAGVGGMVVPVAVYLAFNAGGPAAHGWGIAMSTDTAFALGVLALVGRAFPARLRTYLLTATVVDDVIALAVIAVVYSGDIALPPLLLAVGILAVTVLVRALGVRQIPVYVVLGVAAWAAVQSAGVESYAVVPLFALANAGVTITAGFLGRAFTSAVTLGIVIGYVAGKPVGILGASWLVSRVSRGRLRPPVGWAAVGGGGAIAGIGFTVALLIATLSFTGERLEEAKIGVLSAALCATLVTWVVVRVTALLPPRRRLRALLGTAESIIDLAAPVEPERDHVRGPANAPVTVVEYGDFECPYCGRAESVVRELLADYGDVRYVWRHLPLNDIHPQAQLAAEAAEAAAAQGRFWEMHDLLLDRQDALRPRDLVRYAGEIGLDVDRFRADLRRHTGAGRIAEDVDSADVSGVSGTPTFFVNGRRHVGAYDIATLSAAVRGARKRAAVGS